MNTIINGIKVTYPGEISLQEVAEYVANEQAEWGKYKDIAEIELEIDGDSVVIKAKEKSPIIRVARITGYCSKVTNFNSSKKSELKDRVKHIK